MHQLACTFCFRRFPCALVGRVNDEVLIRSSTQPSGMMTAVATSAASNTRASQALFESDVNLPLTSDQQRRIAQLDFFKKWYLVCHAAYLAAVILTATLALAVLEPRTALIDTFFVAVSTACNCGLQTVDIAEWRTRTNCARRVFMLLGGVVVTSAYQPLARLVMLSRVRSVFLPQDDVDSPSHARTRAQKRACAERLRRTSIICAATPLTYFLTVNLLVWALLWLCNTSSLTAGTALAIVLDSFHSCVFLSMEQLASDTAVVGLVAAACALGFTAFPVVLRGFIRLEWAVLRLLRRVWPRMVSFFSSCSLTRVSSDRSDDSEVRRTLLTDASALHAIWTEEAEGVPGEGATAVEHVWDAAFEEILVAKNAGVFHPFLFRRSETVYLGCAWLALTVLQAAPFWFQQWGHVLAPFSLTYKIYVSLCQAAVVRFAAASFVPLREFTNAHIAVTILAMYLPALPISTDRTYRKWKQMFRTSLVRLLTSRLFWLFMAMVSILFAEEPRLGHYLYNTRFDMMTRTFFEVISAYAGCGLSLSVPAAPEVSFSGSMSTVGKLVIAAVLFGGRHRFVDLGYDLGLGALQPQAPPSSSGTGASLQ